MMLILADENVPGPVIRALRQRGHDVLSVREVIRGADDRSILDRAQREGRLVMTFDKDFGELAFRSGLSSHCGVILFRLTGANPETDNARVVASFGSRNDWEGNFSVVTDNLIRIRPLPKSQS